MKKPQSILSLASLIPYIAVLVGIYLMHSVWVAALGYHLGVLVVLLMTRDKAFNRVHTARIPTALIAANLLIGVGTGLVLYVTWPLFGIGPDIGARLSGMGLTSWPLFALYFLAVNPLLEEIFWHGYLETPSLLPAANDLLFAGYHLLILVLFVRWEWLPVALILLAIASWIWGYTASWRRGLFATTASHFLADVGILLVTYLHAAR